MIENITNRELIHPHVMKVDIDLTKANRRFCLLMSADHHWDNPKTNLPLLRKHHNVANNNGAAIICVGDLFCIMQGKGDPRGSKSDVRPEHASGKYFDKIVSTGVEWYRPYKENYLMVSPGNHESSVRRRHETDLLERFANRLGIPYMTYSGYIILNFKIKKKVCKKITIKYTHGYGGGGPVTKNTIQTNRQAVYVNDADIVFQGHVHQRWALEIMQERVNNVGRSYLKSQWHVQTSTYKEEYEPHSGYHIEKGREPKPLGSWWLNVSHYDNDIVYNLQQTQRYGL